MKEVTIIGAGLTGLLLSILLEQRGYIVKIYERSTDPRRHLLKEGKSINLTLCTRGRSALHKAGILDKVNKLCVASYGRCVHPIDSKMQIQPYGNFKEALFSISRRELHLLLLAEASSLTNISIFFEHKCTGYDLEKSIIFFETKHDQIKEQSFQTLFAADGSYSGIRYQMQRNRGFNYSQFYSLHANKELTIPAHKVKEYKLKENHLHIWPRGEFMIIAFPNPDSSLTCTLQLPNESDGFSFNNLKNEADLLRYFNKYFPELILLMPNLVDDFFQNPEIPMMTVRCSPWYISDKILLIGDAAHAIWPSYGQGANAGFEDCEILVDLIENNQNDMNATFEQFQKLRKPSADSIADLSEKHFHEIRSLVAIPNFQLRKKLERKMNTIFPSEYFSLYCRIAFSKIPYQVAVEQEKTYSKIIDELLTKEEILSNLDSDQSLQTIHDVYNRHMK